MKKISILLTAILFLACEDFLDVKPTGTRIPNTVEDFDKLLNNVKIGYSNVQNVMFMDPDHDLPGDHYAGIWEPIRRRQYGWELHAYEQQDQDPDWNTRYQHINVYNQIINEVDAAALGKIPESSRALVKGEALAQRAFDLFLLVNEYAKHYSPSTLDEPGVPIPLTNDLEAQLPRSTVGEVYNQIFTDLLAAEAALKNVDAIRINANFRPGIASVYALLGEIYLYTGDFANAEKFSGMALDLYNFVYDYHELDHNTPGEPWTALNNGREWYYVTDVKSNYWSRRHFTWFYDPAPLYHPSLVALINTATDRRFYLFSGDNTYYDYDTSVSPNYVFVRDYAATNAGMSVPRSMLTNAEAKARNGDGQGAIARLNELAVYRYTTKETTFTFSTNAAALEESKNERRRELLNTGNHWFDLQRYHAYGTDVVPTFTRDITGVGVVTLEPGSDKYVVSIPRIVINANPNLQ